MLFEGTLGNGTRIELIYLTALQEEFDTTSEVIAVTTVKNISCGGGSLVLINPPSTHFSYSSKVGLPR